MPTLWELIPDADALVAIEPEELGGTLLRVLSRCDRMFHPNSYEGEIFTAGVSRYPAEKQAIVLGAIREAFAWLDGQALIVPSDSSTNGLGGWRVLSRRGHRLADANAWAEYRTGGQLPKALLHSKIAGAAYLDFARGDFQSAVFKSFRDVEVAVREASGITDEVGVRLMRVAFRPGPSCGPLTDPKAEGGEQQALGDLFAGALVRIKILTAIVEWTWMQSMRWKWCFSQAT